MTWPLEDRAVAVDPPAEYPAGYRRCPVCRAYIGAPCMTQASGVIDGQTHGPPVRLDVPHRARKVRAGW